MDFGLLAQYGMNFLMLGMMYALVAVGFTLFFGVLDIIKFSHGDVMMIGAFAAFSGYLGVQMIGIENSLIQLIAILVISVSVTGLLGAIIAKLLILPLKARNAPTHNILLITMMLGTVLREAVRVFFPDGSNPKPFPALLPDTAYTLGSFTLRLDNIILFIAGAVVIVGTYMLINYTKLGLAIRAVAQDEETARTMGINFNRIVMVTFILGSGVAAYAGVMNGLYYNEINFSMGLLLGAIGFAAAIVGGLGSLYGAILGGFLFAFLQTFATVALPLSSAYKDVFAFGVVIAIMAWKPTGLLAERTSERV